MNRGRRIAIAVGFITFLLAVGLTGLFLWKPWVPPMILTDPLPEGRRVITAGNPANFYPSPIAGRQPALLVLGGAEGGLGTGSAKTARALQQAGYSALQLSYFRSEGQREDLVQVPLETFYEALAWLKRQPNVDPERIGILGVSKGAEAALLIASRSADVSLVVAAMPSSVVWQGFSWNGFPVTASSWTYRGHDVEALAFGEGSVFLDVGTVYRNGLKAAQSHPGTAIPIERAQAQVLLICGEDDKLWPSCPMARQLERRAPGKVRVLSYAEAGHSGFGVPGSPTAAKSPPPLGGTHEGNRKAREDSWKKAMEFLQSEFRLEANIAPAIPTRLDRAGLTAIGPADLRLGKEN